jgi:hypothetical protein
LKQDRVFPEEGRIKKQFATGCSQAIAANTGKCRQQPGYFTITDPIDPALPSLMANLLLLHN